MFRWFQAKCSMCKRKRRPLQRYIGRGGGKIKVCPECAEYAERRAFRKGK